MGMRFDKVKTDDWVRLGSALGNAYVDHNAGNAYKEGTKVNTRTDSNYGAMDPNAVYSGEGADGAMTNAEAASYGLNVPKQDPVAGTGVTRQYGLGQNPTNWQDTQFTPDQTRLAGLRAQMAYHDGRGDSQRSKALLGQIAEMERSERDAARFGWEKAEQPLKQKQLEQQTRTGEIQLGQAERGLSVQGAEDMAMKLPEAEVRSQLTGYLNTNKSDLPLLVLGTNKGGFIMAERDPATGAIGEQFSVPLAVGRKLVVGRQLAEKGFGKEALQYLTGVDDNITAIIDRYNKNALDVARTNNDATAKAGALANDRARVGIAAEGLKIRQQEAENANWQLIGATGDGTGLVRYNRNSGAVVNQPLPAGVDAKSVWGKISGAKPDISVEKVYEQLVGAPIPGQPKGSVYTPQMALEEARRITAGQQDPLMQALDKALGGTGDPFAQKPMGIQRPAAPAPAAPARAPVSQPASPEWFAKAQQELQTVNAAVAQAEAQAQAAARSGDRSAIIQYGNRLNELRARQSQLQGALQPYTR